MIIHGRPDLVLTSDPRCSAAPHRGPIDPVRPAGLRPRSHRPGNRPGQPRVRPDGTRPARTLKPPVSILEIFPWGELALHGALLGAVSLFLSGTAAEANARLKAVDTELSSLSWVKDQDQAKLDSEKKVLQEQSKVIEAFRGNRVDWSVPLRTIAAAAPRDTIVTGLSGDAEVETSAESAPAKSKKQLLVNFATPMAEDGSVPREIVGFLATMRNEPTLKRHFPLIEVSGLRANAAQAGNRPFTSYSIMCLPKTESRKTTAAH